VETNRIKKKEKTMEEKIKRLRQHLQKLYPTLDSGLDQKWAVGEEEIWRVEKPEDAGNFAEVFKTCKLRGVWVIEPFTFESDIKKNITFKFSVETADKLKQLAEIEKRSQSGELEFLINERWKDVQAS